MKNVLLFVVGLLAANSVWAQWEPDVRLTDDPDSSLTTHSKWGIAAFEDIVHVVWSDKRDGNWEIYYKRSTDAGISWGSDTRLTIMPEDSRSPSIAVAGTNVYVVWDDFRDGYQEVYYKFSTDGGLSWGTDTRLDDNTSRSYKPSISVFGSVVHVTWTDLRDGNHEVYYKRSTDGGLIWETAIRLSDEVDVSYVPSIATSGSNVHIVWCDTRDGNHEIYYKRSTDGGITWGADTRLTNAIGTSTIPSIAVSGTELHVVWLDFRDGNTEIYYKHSLDGGTSWGEDTRLTENLGNSIYSNIAVSGQVVHVAWEDSREGNYHIYYKRSEDGGENWGADSLISGNGIMSSHLPSVAVSASTVHMVWYDDRDGNLEIYYKRNPTGGFPVGINNELTRNFDQAVNIYPNPASSLLHIDFNSLTDDNLDLRIIDLSGQTIGSYNFASSRGLNQYAIDVKDFCNGRYFIQLTSRKQRHLGKIVICK